MKRAVLGAMLGLIASGCSQEQPETPVQPRQAGKMSSPLQLTAEKQLVVMRGTRRECFWNDRRYSDGALVCDSRQRYACWDGRWVSSGMCV